MMRAAFHKKAILWFLFWILFVVALMTLGVYLT